MRIKILILAFLKLHFLQCLNCSRVSVFPTNAPLQIFILSPYKLYIKNVGLGDPPTPPPPPLPLGISNEPPRSEYGYLLDPMDSIWLERLSNPPNNMNGISLSLSQKENVIFHWNLFVSNGSPSLGGTFHQQTSGFPMESKGIWLEPSWQYWTALLKLGSTTTVDSDCTAPALHWLMY